MKPIEISGPNGVAPRAIANPAAMQGYAATVQKLTGQLFADPAFVEASR